MTADPGLAESPVTALRARRRLRGIALSSGAAIGQRALSVSVSIVTIPLVIDYLGAERFGLWATLTALTAMLAFADLGLGNGLLNIVSEAEGRDDPELARRAISTTFFTLVGIAVLVALGAILAAASLPWADVFGTTQDLASMELAPGLAVFVALFAAGIPLAVAERTRLGLQQAHVSSLWAIVGVIGTLGGVLVAVSTSAPLPMLIALTGAPPLLAAALNFLHLFLVVRPDLRPRPHAVTRALAPRLASLGILFVVLQLAVSVAFQSDVVVAAAVLGPEAAATYSVAARVFLFVPSLIGMALVTVWPAYGEALSRGDIGWVRVTLRRSIGAAFGISLAASLALLTASPWVFGLLTGGKLPMPLELLLGMAVWAVVLSVFTSISMLLNAASVLKFQVIVATVMAGASIALSWVLAGVLGVAGVVAGTLIAYVTFAGVPTLAYLPRLLRSLEQPRGNKALPWG